MLIVHHSLYIIYSIFLIVFIYSYYLIYFRFEHTDGARGAFDRDLPGLFHDDFFVNRAAEHLFDFHGSYTEYLEYRRDLK